MIFLFTLVPPPYDCWNRSMCNDGTSLLCPRVRKPPSFTSPVGKRSSSGRLAIRPGFFLRNQMGSFKECFPWLRSTVCFSGHSLSSLPFCVYGGIAATSESAREVLDSAAQALATQLKVDYLEYRNLKIFHSQWPTKDLYVTFRKEMAPEAEENMQAIPRKQRAMVRKGIKAGLESAVDEDVERFFSAYAASVHRLGTPVFSKKYFRLLKEIFTRNCELMIITKKRTNRQRRDELLLS